MFFWWSLLFFYSENPDSVLQQSNLESTPAGERLILLWEQANQHERVSARTAIETGLIGLELARSQQDQKAIADFSSLVGFNFGQVGNYVDAITHQTKALELYKQLEDERGTAKSLNNLGIIYHFLGREEKSLDFLLQAMRLRERLDDPLARAKTLNNIGLVHFSLAHYERALTNFQASLAIKHRFNDRASITRTLSNIGQTYWRMGRIDEALETQQEAMSISQEIDFSLGIAYAAKSMGEIYQTQGRYSEALTAFQQANKLYAAEGETHGTSMTFINMGACLARLALYQQAIDAVTQGLELANKIDAKPRIRDAYEILADIHQRKGDYKQALSHYQVFSSVKDELISQEVKTGANELEVRYETEKKEQEIELLKRDAAIRELGLRRQRLQRNSSLLGLFLTSALAFLLFWRYRENRRNHLKITQSHQMLADAYNKLETLARTDPLTSLWNRRGFLEQAHPYFEDIAEHRSLGVSLILGDLDGFKQINDVYGHDAGDMVLKEVAQVMRSMLKDADIVGRWGGEEFIILAANLSKEQGVGVAERLREAIAKHRFEFQDERLPVTITFGICHLEQGAFDHAVKRADQALYSGKRAGGNTVVPGTLAHI